MSDRLVRGVFPDHNIRFAASYAPAMCGEAVTRHQSDWISGSLLCESLMCAALLSTTLKGEEKITLRWMYGGPVGLILADMTERGEVRGFTQRVLLFPEVTSVADAVGRDGRITAVTSTPRAKLRTGITESVFQDVPRDLAYFLSLSFQIETALAVGLIMPDRERVSIASAAGLMLQPLPHGDLQQFDEVRQRVEHPTFQTWLEAEPRQPEEMLEHLALGEPAQIYDELEPAYYCHCSRAKAERVLRMYDPGEVRDMLETDGHAEVNCHFCAARYVFSADELREILRQSQAGNA